MTLFEMLQERRFTIGGLSATQTVNASAIPDKIIITTVFSLPAENGIGLEHVSTSSFLPAAEAESLANEEWRERLARKHMAELVGRQRYCAQVLDAAVKAVAS